MQGGAGREGPASPFVSRGSKRLRLRQLEKNEGKEGRKEGRRAFEKSPFLPSHRSSALIGLLGMERARSGAGRGGDGGGGEEVVLLSRLPQGARSRQDTQEMGPLRTHVLTRIIYRYGLKAVD